MNSSDNPIKLAILWHMHQPNYQEPDSARLVMPWVRLHATKDYLDMPLLSSKYENIKTTFNLVPSLLDQLELYLNGGTDPHLELSRINAESLSTSQRKQLLSGFFLGNPPTMIVPHRRYCQLYQKATASLDQQVMPELFSSQELRDLQVWSNLSWVDPVFHTEEPIRSLLKQEKHFREEDKHALLDWQIALIRRIVTTYGKLLDDGLIDISFTPYYHPILPLLCDTDVAREATPKIELPRHRFAHQEDARWQIEAAMEKYRSLFGRELVGMWPSEGSVSEQMAGIMIESGVKWIATDEEILHGSLRNANQPVSSDMAPTVYDYGPGLKLFFRDHMLSDRIGFVYSGWDADKAVDDFISKLKEIRSKFENRLDDVVVTVILDGENAWEYFTNDGHEFLDELYRRLSEDSQIEVLTMTEAATRIQSQPLPALMAGSWINHNFRIWIGHPEDNNAWELLWQARKRLVDFQSEHPDFDREKIEKAWRQIYIAEGSDWCWWYGDEHRGEHNKQFDQIYRRHLMAVYEFLGLEIPLELLNPIYKSGTEYEAQMPDALLTPDIDGRLTSFYEWAGAGYHDCGSTAEVMHRVDRPVSRLYYGFDHTCLYIRLDFLSKKVLESIEKLLVRITFYGSEANNGPEANNGSEAVHSSEARDIELAVPTVGRPYEQDPEARIACVDILEIALDRSKFLSAGHGTADFAVTILDGAKKLQIIPAAGTITFDLPEKNHEFFWPI